MELTASCRKKGKGEKEYGANRLNTTNLDSGQIGREIFKKLSCKFYGPNNYFMSNFGHYWSKFGIFRPFQLIR